MPTPTTPPADALFHHRAFAAFWFARIASGFGFQMLSVAVGWQIYALTGRAFDLGLIGLVQFVPSVLLALPAGHVADQFERRRIVLLGQLVAWVAIALLAGLSLSHRVHELGILLLVFALGVAKAFESPALQSMLPALVPAALLPRAMAVNAAAGQAAMIMGPALGGLLYVAGPGVVYAVAALLYLASVILLTRLRYEQPPPRREPATLKTVFAGVHFIRARKDVLGVISLDLFAVLLGGATALLPIFARDILHTGPWGLGLLRAAPAVGALLISLWLARHSLQRHVGPIMFASVTGFGVATLVFALSTTLWLSLLALFALGAFDMVVESAGPIAGAGAYQSSGTKQIYAVTVKVTNGLRAPEKFGWQYATPTLTDLDGKELHWSSDVIDAGSGQSVGPELAPGRVYSMV